MTNLKMELKEVKAFVFDVDGVFSNGSVYLYPEGDIVRSMNIKDGYVVQLMVKLGYPITIITGGNSNTIRTRFSSLGVTDIYLGSKNKMVDFEHFLKKYGLNKEHILYMGDDIPDYEIMCQVGFPACPADAAEEIKQISKYISDKNGGEGCVRDILEQFLKLQGQWLNKEAFHW